MDHQSRQIIPPEISVTDEKGNVKSHSEFSNYMNYHQTDIYGNVKHSSLSHRAHTFTTLQDACMQGIGISPTREVDDVRSVVANNGIYNMSILHCSLENIILAQRMTSKQADEILREVRCVLESRDIDYELTADHSVKLTHSDLQLKMEVVRAGNDSSDLRFRHMSGDSGQCKELCKELLQCMSL